MTQDDTIDILRRLGTGEEHAAAELLPRIYGELKQLAEKMMRRERNDHTLQATILVHEAYLKLVNNERANWQDRSHFLAVAATQMRRFLIDHARKYNAAKRNANNNSIAIEDASEQQLFKSDKVDVLHLDEILTELAEMNPRHAKVVEFRYFAGMTVKETALALGVSEATVKNDWRAARAWMLIELQQG